jgi:glycosyltransferase involved in cell wall biosynthesis
MTREVSYKLSIVVPVGRLNGDIAALESWISIAKNTQIILVLDHSDNATRDAIQSSSAISDHSGIQIFQVDFRNPGDSRNFGLKRASGSWILFADSDDVPKILNIENAIDSVQENEDVIVGNFEVFAVRTEKITSYEAESLNDLINNLPKNLGLWRFVFRNEFLRNSGIQFPTLSMAEDQVFFLEMKRLEPQFRFVNLIFYTYYIGNSYQLTSNPEKIQDLKKAIVLTLESISDEQSFLNLDFLSAQIFSLISNSSRKYIFSNLLFVVRIFGKIINRLGLRKMLMIFTYPARRTR